MFTFVFPTTELRDTAVTTLDGMYIGVWVTNGFWAVGELGTPTISDDFTLTAFTSRLNDQPGTTDTFNYSFTDEIRLTRDLTDFIIVKYNNVNQLSEVNIDYTYSSTTCLLYTSPSPRDS